MERESEGDDIQAAVLRMNGQGEKSIGEWVVCLRVDTLVRLLKEAGYAAEEDAG